ADRFPISGKTYFCGKSPFNRLRIFMFFDA
ncbi:MAG: hypothetical protein ACI92E_000561, partial [Oceanicoccus sp.]